MGNTANGKFWTLDTAGVITRNPVYVKSVNVTFKVSSAGVVQLDQVSSEDGVATGDTFFYAVSLGATSAAVDQMTQVYPIDQWVYGLKLTTITNIDKLIINTK